MHIEELESKSVAQLRQMARDAELPAFSRLKKAELVLELLRNDAQQQGLVFGGGVLEVAQDGIGFLRERNMRAGESDVYVSQSQIRRFLLRTGDLVIGQVRPPKDNEKYRGLLRVGSVNGLPPEATQDRPRFEDLTPIFPDELLRLETERESPSRPASSTCSRPSDEANAA